jgi:hypothetical protein
MEFHWESVGCFQSIRSTQQMQPRACTACVQRQGDSVFDTALRGGRATKEVPEKSMRIPGASTAQRDAHHPTGFDSVRLRAKSSQVLFPCFSSKNGHRPKSRCRPAPRRAWGGATGIKPLRAVHVTAWVCPDSPPVTARPVLHGKSTTWEPR